MTKIKTKTKIIVCEKTKSKTKLQFLVKINTDNKYTT